MRLAKRVVLVVGILVPAAGCRESITDELYASQADKMMDHYAHEIDELERRAKEGGAPALRDEQLAFAQRLRERLQQARAQLRNEPSRHRGPWHTVVTRARLLGHDFADLFTRRASHDTHGAPAPDP